MPIQFDAYDEFVEALDEVRVLVRSAARSTLRDKYYKAINKSSVLLLTAKFESFLENILEEYLSFINKKNLEAKKIPNIYKLHHTFPVIEMICEHKANGHKHVEIIKTLQDIARLWALEDEKFAELDIQFKFNYGKHGEKEVIKLFEKIGIHNIFLKIKIYEYIGGVRTQIDIKGKFNSITNIRNNIIHSDANPALTHTQIKQYLTTFQKFAKALVKVLDKAISKL
jgi:hypothetical protein